MSRILVALALLATPLLATAQSSTPMADSSRVTAIGAFLAISVADLEASSKWYVEKLGVKRTAQGGRMERLAGYVVLEGNGWIVELIKHDDSVRPSVSAPELVQGFTKAGALVADFDRAISLLRARGVEIVMGPYPPRESMRANAVIRDNSGNLIQLFGDYSRR